MTNEKTVARQIIEGYCRRHGEEITEIHESFNYESAGATLASGRTLWCKMSHGRISASANVRNAFRLYDTSGEKTVAIKKTEW